jgi:hypothetical protein
MLILEHHALLTMADITNHNVMNPHADPRELRHAKNADNHRIRCADCGRREEKNDQ